MSSDTRFTEVTYKGHVMMSSGKIKCECRGDQDNSLESDNETISHHAWDPPHTTHGTHLTPRMGPHYPCSGDSSTTETVVSGAQHYCVGCTALLSMCLQSRTLQVHYNYVRKNHGMKKVCADLDSKSRHSPTLLQS